MNYSISYVLLNKFQGRKWTLHGDDYSGLIIHDKLAAPTMAEIIAADAQLYAANQAVAYRAQRGAIYPAIGDQLDMLWHSMDSGEIPKCAEFYNACAAIKAQYPKPTENTNATN